MIPLKRGVLYFNSSDVVFRVFNDALESLCLVVCIRSTWENCFPGFYRVIIGYDGVYTVDDVRWAKCDVFSKPSHYLDNGIRMEVDNKHVKEETLMELFNTFAESD